MYSALIRATNWSALSAGALGYQHTLAVDNDWLNGWVLGIKATYRNIHNAIDDSCSSQALYNAANEAGYDTSNWDDEWTT
ncbi:hypothetical protein HF319_10650, partial [Xanthomonas sp. Kuri4-1]